MDFFSSSKILEQKNLNLIRKKIRRYPSTQRIYFAVGVFAVLLITALDFITGHEISFGIFYLIPILYFALCFGYRAGFILVFLSSVLWLICDLAAGHVYTHSLIPIWNAVTRLTFFFLITLMIKNLEAESKNLRVNNVKLKRLNRKLELMSRMKTDFTAMVSHELRTPMAAIKEGVNLVHEGILGPVNAEQKNFLNIARKNIDRLVLLINDILDFAKLEAGKSTLNLNEANIGSLIKEIADLHRPSIEEKSLELILEIEEPLPLMRFDWDGMTQVITNLLSNAIKFTAKGQIQISVMKEGESIGIKIIDSGCGIPHADKGKIFAPYEQIVNKMEGKQVGTGLGLAISKKIVEFHQGKISFTSVPGQGSVFMVTLPIKRS